MLSEEALTRLELSKLTKFSLNLKSSTNAASETLVAVD
jgi:hypothetical protein